MIYILYLNEVSMLIISRKNMSNIVEIWRQDNDKPLCKISQETQNMWLANGLETESRLYLHIQDGMSYYHNKNIL